MAEKLSGNVYASYRVWLMSKDGLPSRVCYEQNAHPSRMGAAERAIFALFADGIDELCRKVRQASRELRAATVAAEGCANRDAGKCSLDGKPCSMVCDVVASAVNSVRAAHGNEITNNGGSPKSVGDATTERKDK